MTKEEIDQKYLEQANQLEVEFFDIIDEGLPSQHRVLKAGKSLVDFDLAHNNIWKAHEAELVAEGFMEAPLPPEPPLVFEPPAGTGMPEKVEYIEDFLKKAFPQMET